MLTCSKVWFWLVYFFEKLASEQKDRIFSTISKPFQAAIVRLGEMLVLLTDPKAQN